MGKGYLVLFHGLMPGSIALMALFFLGLGTRAWVSRRPFLVSQRWVFGLICLVYIPLLLQPFFLPHSARVPASLVAMQWMNPAMLGLLLVYFWFLMRGYLAVAVTEQSFRDALLASAAKLGYTVEETMAAVRLLPAGVQVRVNVQGWVGTGLLRAKARGDAPVVDALAREMNLHYAEKGGAANYVTALFYTVMGLFMAATAVSIFFVRFGR